MNLTISQNNSRERWGKGATLYFAIIVLFIILGIGIGIGSLLTTELKTVRSGGESLQAFYAADTGIERLRMIDRCMSFTGPRSQSARQNCLIAVLEVGGISDVPVPCRGGGDVGLTSTNKQTCRKESFANVIEAGPFTSNTIGNGEYSLCQDAADPANCNIEDASAECPEYCAKSTGSYKETRRAVEMVK